MWRTSLSVGEETSIGADPVGRSAVWQGSACSYHVPAPHPTSARLAQASLTTCTHTTPSIRPGRTFLPLRPASRYLQDLLTASRQRREGSMCMEARIAAVLARKGGG